MPDLLPPGPELDALLVSTGVEVTHFFVGESYVKLIQMPAGSFVGQHSHTTDHLAVLLVGTAVLVYPGVFTEHLCHAPQTFTIRAHRRHEIQAITPVLWCCLWPAKGQTDTVTLERALIES